jgi:tryptophan 2,3-dioxygenase
MAQKYLMLKGEHVGESLGALSEPLRYGSYLRVPELLNLQFPLSAAPEHDEMLFIIVQRIQELWFKQLLHELRLAIDLLGTDKILELCRYLSRMNRILAVLGDETIVLETMPPDAFLRFRKVLAASSGLEPEQFRELEYALAFASRPSWPTCPSTWTLRISGERGQSRCAKHSTRGAGPASTSWRGMLSASG